MTTDWHTESAGSELVGRVTYRCATCGEVIEEDILFVGDGPDTRTYHLDHAPIDTEETDHGR